MRALQKITRNGNANGVSIPRVMLVHLGWLPGENVVLELLEDKSLRVRRVTERDVAPLGPPRLLPDPLSPVTV